MAENLYVDGSYPKWVVQASKDINGNAPVERHANHYWLSQPRTMDDQTSEVLLIKFRQPVSVSEISWELLELNANYEFWYVNRSKVRTRILDTSRRPLSGVVNTGDIAEWRKFTKSVYPFVATQIEVRLKRLPDPFLPKGRTYSLGMRNLLIKRNVVTRSDTMTQFETTTDLLGNVVSKTVKAWDPLNATDDQSFTYWKSAPQPDPNAVVSYYMDCRDADGNAQKVDRVYLDPVYAGQQLNMYYSDDDTVGTRRLGSSTLAPSLQTNAIWEVGKGLHLNNTTAEYRILTKDLGFQQGTSFWVGLVWSPEFDSTSAPSEDLSLFQDGATPVPNFKIAYQSNTQKIFVLMNGNTVMAITDPVEFFSGQDVIIAVQVTYQGQDQTPGVTLVVNSSAQTQTITSAKVPVSDDLVGHIKFQNVVGYMKAALIKQSTSTNIVELQQFVSDPYVYITPDPVIEDSEGRLPTTTLDNAIFGVDWTQQELPYGGLDNEFFASKVWSPIWRDWTVYKGFYYFPRPVMLKYLKLEFTSLTEEQYPIWQSGVEVKYKTFPIHVTETNKTVSKDYTGTKTTNGKKQTIDPSKISPNYADQKITYPQDVEIDIGAGIVDDVPHMFDSPVEQTVRKETSSSVVYNRTDIDTVQVSKNVNYTVVSGDWLIKIAAKYDIPWEEIYRANKKTIDNDPRVKKLPKRSPGWWIFPGQKLKIPVTVMEKIKRTTTVTERKTTTTVRNRFTLTSVHQYKLQTVKRDAAIAYFAGLREINVFRLNYVAAEDTAEYVVDVIDNVDFTTTNLMTVAKTGATLPSVYRTHLKNEANRFSLNISTTGDALGTTAGVVVGGNPDSSTTTLSVVPGGDLEGKMSAFRAVHSVGTLQDYNLFTVSENAYRTPGSAGRYYTFSSYVKIYGSDTKYCRLVLRFYDSSGAQIGSTLYGDRFLMTNQYTRVHVTRVAPAGTATVGCSLKGFEPGASTTVAETWDTCRWQMEEGPTATFWGPSVQLPGTITSNTWNSTSTFTRLDVDLIGKSPQRVVNGISTLVPVGVTNVETANWTDVSAVWEDTIAVWGANAPLVGVSFLSDYQFNGEDSAQVNRAAGSGVAGVETQTFKLIQNARIRLGVNVFVPAQTTNTYKLQLVNKETGAVLWEEVVKPTVGQWSHLTTKYHKMTASYPLATARLIIDGVDAETLYVGDLYPEITTILFEVSNDGGANYYEATEVVWEPNAYFVFPTEDNRLRTRVTLYDVNDFVYGMELRPLYLH
ncbi:LysM peptidoglycan-binding domain-containing protein [Streptomyces sp. CoH17]|uniref:LysM peptidoglycan-binding domain-containing protein n=1 Tax=Streptomyces sp. CoH17 TaxID=2992806 RepID=UPI00226F7036|nr:LysM domain-containing protein [Streptomyces sp. CoH17]